MVVSKLSVGVAPPSDAGADAADPGGSQLTTTHHSQGIPAVYTAEEAALILRVKKSWLERQAAARKVPFTMLGRSYRFTSVHLAVIVRMHEQATAPTAPADDGGTRSRRPGAQPRVTGRGQEPLRPRPRNGP